MSKAKLLSITIGLAYLWAIGAHAQLGVITANQKPDITTHGITLNNSFISGGPVTTVGAGQAKAKVNGQCQFEMAYHMLNKADVATQPAFSNKLMNNNVQVLVHANLALAPGESRVKTFNVFLIPGMNTFKLYLDNLNQVAESNEDNNYRVAKINLTGSCLDKITHSGPSTPGKTRGIEHEDIGIRQR